MRESVLDGLIRRILDCDLSISERRKKVEEAFPDEVRGIRRDHALNIGVYMGMFLHRWGHVYRDVPVEALEELRRGLDQALINGDRETDGIQGDSDGRG